jgi:tetratricopeptide (TPR) repeat protein
MRAVRLRLIVAASVFACGFALYVPSIGSGFVWDDLSLIRDNRYVHDGSHLAANLTGDFFRRSGDRTSIGHWRPLVTATYMADWRIGGGAPATFHAHNALLHGLAAALVALLALELGLSRAGALAAGLLFAAHPAHVEAVSWISGRPDLLCGLFVAAALVLDARSGARGGVLLGALSAAATCLGLLAKEMAVVVAIAAPLRAAWMPGAAERGRGILRRAIEAGWPHAAVIAAYAVVRFGLLGILPRAPAAAAAGRLALFRTWWSAFLEYARVLVWPAHMSIVPRIEIVSSLASPRVAAGAALFAAAAVAAWRIRVTRPAAAWALAAFLTSLGPLTNFVVPVRAAAGVPFPWAERFLFVPSIFVALAAAALLDRSGPRRRPWVWAGLAIVLLALATRAVARQRVWTDQKTLFAAAVAEAPGDSGAEATLGGALADAGDWAGAEDHLRRAVARAPDNALARFNLGNVLRHREDLAGAGAEYEAAVAAEPGHPQAWLNLGLVRVAEGRLDDAVAAFRAADLAMGGYAEAKFDLATLLRGTGRPAEAIPLYEEALRLDPSLDAARAGLAAAKRESSAP